MKRVFFLLAIICTLTISASAQKTSGMGTSYTTAFGGKVYVGNGTFGGLNIKHFVSKSSAVDGSLLFGNDALGLEALYEWHGAISNAAGLKYFVGGGGLLAFSTHSGNSTAFDLRLTGGLDYKIPSAPIDLAVSFDPFFQVAPNQGSNFALGLAFRYVF